MFARISNEPVASDPQPPPVNVETVHLMLVKTPSLTPRGQAWLERAQAPQSSAFNPVELERLIRFEKLSLG
jgi:hypothetical protein